MNSLRAASFALALLLAAPAASVDSSDAGSKQRKSVRGSEKAAPHHCTARFYDRQNGRLLGEQPIEFSELPPKTTVVDSCLSRAVQAGVPGAIAFACECDGD